MAAQVNVGPDSWARQYAEVLTKYAERPSPELLRRAADLGRTRRQQGAALSEIAAAHASALAALLCQQGGSTPELVQVASPVLSQCLEAYGAACEEELQTQCAAQRRFREIADCAQVFLYRIRLDDGSFEYVSPSCDQLTGFTADELRTMGPAGVFRQVHPEDQPHVPTPRRDVEVAQAEDRWQRPFAFRFRNRQGEYRWFSGARVLIRNDRGEPVAAVGTFRDVTVQRQAEERLRASEAELRRHREQLEELVAQRTADLARLNERLQAELAEHRRTEQALRESEERFRQLAENIREAFWLSEPNSRRLLYVSPALETVWGLSGQEAYRNPQAWMDAIHPEDRAAAWASMEQQNRGLATDCEYRILRPDGTIRRIRNRGFPIRNAAGEVYRVAGIAEDVTAQRQAEDELRIFQAISDQAAYGTATIDLAGRITYANDAFAQMHGYTPAELLGQHVSVLHSAEQMPRANELLARLRQGDGILGEEVWHAHRSGRVFPTLMNITQIADEHGRPAFLSGTAIDITERKQAEAVLQLQLDLGTALSATSDPQEALTKILEAACRVEAIDCGAIYLVGEQGALDLVVHRNLSAELVAAVGRFEADSGVARVVLAGRPHYPKPDEARLPAELRRHEGLRAVASIPVKHEGRSVAALNVGSHTHDELPHSTRQAIEVIAARIGGVIARLRALQALAESEMRFRVVCTAAPVGIFLADAEARCLYVNRALQALCGLSEAQCLGHGWSQAIHPEDRPDVLAAIGRHRQTDADFSGEFRLQRRDKSVRWVHVRTTDVSPSSGALRCRVGIVEDVTERRRAEDVLRESENQLRLITDNVPAMIVYVDAERRYRFANERFAKWRGVSREQVLGRPVRAVLGDEFYTAIEPHIAAVLAGRQVSYEIQIDRSGDPHWLSVTYVPDRDEADTVRGFYALIHDVTQQKQTEQTLRASEERLQRVVTEMPVLLDAFDTQGKIAVWNRECERVTGYPASEIIGNADAMRMFYPDAAYREVVLASIRKEHGDHHNVEFELTCKDGSRRTIAWSNISGAVPIPGWATWGVGIDVTERKRAEAALRASEKMFRTLAETVPAAIMIAQGDSMRYANETAARMVGCTLDEFLAQSPWAHVHPHEQEVVRQRSLARQAGQPAPSRYEIRVAGRDGGERWLDMSVATVEYEGRPASLAAALDITERKQAEEAARQHHEQLAHVARVSAVGEMASGLAHELAQPLTAILYFAKGCITRLTSGVWGTAEAVRTLEKVAAQAERAGVFIRQLKAFVRKAERQRVRSDLNGIVREALSFVAGEARAHQVDVRLDLGQELPAVVVDPVQIEQVILNLVRNAIEALATMPAERRALTIRTVRGPDDTVQVSVSDSGPGVPPESAPLVFDPFFTTKPGGTGLGLSISRSLVEAHDGKLWVEGGPAGGAVFSFVLPVARGESDVGR